MKPGTGLHEDFINGEFTLCSDDEKLLEVRTVIEKADGVDTRLVSDHIINLLQKIEGSLKNDKAKLLDMIDEYLSLPDRERRLYQAARRMARVNDPSDMIRLAPSEINQLKRFVDSIEDPYEWEIRMNSLISRYI